MTKDEIISQVKSLKLPEGSYVVYGSCPLALAGLRESNDVDMLVTREVFDELEKSGWPRSHKDKYDNPLTRGVFELHYNWNFSAYSPTLEQLLSTATVVNGVPFASLDEVRRWKAASGRPKDLIDIKLIDDYLKQK